MKPLSWLKEGPRLRKRALRYTDPGVIAHYWDGTGQMDHSVKDISLSGAYLRTRERWYVGSVVVLTLEQEEESATVPKPISIPCRVARHGPDGVGVSFLLHIDEDRRALQHFMRTYVENSRSSQTLGDAVTAEG